MFHFDVRIRVQKVHGDMTILPIGRALASEKMLKSRNSLISTLSSFGTKHRTERYLQLESTVPTDNFT